LPRSGAGELVRRLGRELFTLGLLRAQRKRDGEVHGVGDVRAGELSARSARSLRVEPEAGKDQHGEPGPHDLQDSCDCLRDLLSACFTR
jgi:hypothetical protein